MQKIYAIAGLRQIANLNNIHSRLRTLMLALFFSTPLLVFGQFTSGNLVVLQVGDGSAALTNAGTAFFMKEFTPAGVAGTSVTIPSSGASQMVLSGTATSEGLLSRSADGQFLVFGGYAAPAGTAGIASTTAAAANRAVGTVNASGTFTRAATSSTFFSGNNMRSAASDGSNNYWAHGANDGTNYFGTASAAATLQSSKTNTRFTLVQNGNLYMSSGSTAGTPNTTGIFQVGSGLPVTSGQSLTTVINTTIGTSPSPFQFIFNSTGTICYVADDRSISNGGGIQKWTFNGSAWSLTYTLATGSGSTVGARGVVADFSGANPIVYATTAESALNRLIKITDTGASSGATATTLATAGTNTIFRGLAFAPQAAAGTITVIDDGSCLDPTPGTLLSFASSSGSPVRNSYSGVTANGGNPLTVVWSAANNRWEIRITTDLGCGAGPQTYLLHYNDFTSAPNPPSLGTGTWVPVPVADCAPGSFFTCSNLSTFSGTGTQNNCGTGCPPASCPTFSSAPANVSITNSTCASACTVSGGVITAPSGTPCPAGSTLQYQVNNGSWTTTLPTYAQNGPAQSIKTRCSCDSDNTMNSAESVAVATVPGTCTPPTAGINVAETSGTTNNDGIICTGASATLTGTGGTSYAWSNGVNTAANPVTPASTTTYTVTVTNANTCTATATQTITVNGLPTVNISYAPNDTVCVGVLTTLTASGGTSYSWSTGANTAAATVTPASQGSSFYTVTVTNANGCTKSANAFLIAYNAFSLNAPTIVQPTTCVSANGSITLNISGSNGGFTYNWTTSNGSGLVNGQQNQSGLTVGTYNVTLTAAYGCSATATYTLTGPGGCNDPCPAIGAVNVTPTSVCSSATVSATASGLMDMGSSYGIIFKSFATTTSDPYTGGTTLATVPNGALGSGGTTATATFNIPTAGGYVIYAILTPTPSNAACRPSANTNLTVNALPTPGITVSETSGTITNDGVICVGATATLTGTGGTSYAWSNGGNTNAINVTPASTTTFTVTVTNANGCTATSTSTITVNPLPTPGITVTETSGTINNDGVICAGALATLTGTGGTSYAWSNGVNIAANTVTPASTTTYTVTVTNANGCTASTTTTITVNPLPSTTITAIPNPVNLGSVVNLSVPTAGAGASYNWAGNGIVNTNADATTATPTAGGAQTYSVTVTNSNACSAIGTTTVTVKPTVSLSVSANSGSEVNTTSITVTATANAAVSGNQTVTLAVTGAGITAGDYYLTSTTITILSGQTTGTVTFVVADDAVTEVTETAILTISNPSAGIALGSPVTQNIVITNNDCTFLRKAGGVVSANGAEIPAFDPGSNRVFSVAGSVIEVFTLDNTGALSLVGSLPIGFTPAAGTIALPNSVSVKNGVVAASYAVVNSTTNAQSPGQVTFYTAATGAVINSVTVGFLPDMLTFSPDGTKVLTANEGEPNSYGQGTSFDPEGSVSIIDISGGAASASVNTVGFTSFNSQAAALRAAGVRIFGPGATVAQDFEPEYIAFSGDGATAMITLQENNALAVLNIASATFTSIVPLGTKNHNLAGNGMDASDRDLTSSTGKINIQNWPVSGMYMPDAIGSYVVGGQTYYVTANEGDSRSYTGFDEEIRVGAAGYVLDPVKFPNAATLKQNANLGRLQLTSATGDTDGDTDIDVISALGARSFSIWNAAGALVYDSGDQLEQLTAAKTPSVFNSDGAAASFDTRSDNKGPEPEGVAMALINGRNYAFIGIERVGDIAIYDVTDPLAPTFVQLINTPEDIATEGLVFVTAANSPTGNALLITTSEVSRTIAVFELGFPSITIAVAETSGLANNDAITCAGGSVTLTAAGGGTYSWSTGANTAAITVNPATTTTYTVTVTNAAGCTATSSSTITVNPLPTPSITVAENSGIEPNDGSICTGASATLTATGGGTYAWSTGASTAEITVSPASTTTYTVTVTNANGCTATSTRTITVNPLPTPSIAVTETSGTANNDGQICAGASATLTASGGTSYAWSNGVNAAVNTVT
ncbi:MAG: choice-of-anchor I family protein, partial [Saprospiraceae bacterium]|nr:choice-of-anchor I family protein [Saprospiraceae bacterium]